MSTMWYVPRRIDSSARRSVVFVVITFLCTVIVFAAMVIESNTIERYQHGMWRWEIQDVRTSVRKVEITTTRNDATTQILHVTEPAAAKLHVDGSPRRVTTTEQKPPTHFIVGPRLDGKIYLTGAQITVPHYEQGVVFIHIFAITNALFTVESRRRRVTRWKELIKNPSLGLMKSLWSVDDIQQHKFACRLKTDNVVMVPALLLPIDSIDPMAADTTHIWQCDVSSYLSPAQLSTKSSVEFDFIVTDSSIHVVDSLSIDTHAGSIGWGGPENETLQPMFATNHPVVVDILLCVGGVDHNGINLLLQFVTYHFNMGVDLMIIGLHEKPQSNDYHRIHHMLLPFIEAGKIQLSITWVDPKVIQAERDSVKMQFYNSCLYFGKTRAKYVATFDPDEYFFAPEIDGVGGLKNAVQRLDEEAKLRNDCPNWCFVSFPSYTTHGHNSTVRYTERDSHVGFYPVDYPFRERGANWIWQKSVMHSAVATSSGYHFPGTCFVRGTYQTLTRGRHPCAIAAHDTRHGAFRHYQGIFYTDTHPEDEVLDMVKDEFEEFAIRHRQLFEKVM